MTVHVLLVYNSKEGQTARVAERIATRLRSRGATVVSATAADDPSPTSFDLVVAGDSIHLGRHSRPLKGWLRRHREDLAGRPLALFQVSLTSRDRDPDSEAEARGYLDDLVAATGVFTEGHAPPGALDGMLKLARPGGLILFSLTDQAAQNLGFGDRIAELNNDGAWQMRERTEPFRPLPFFDDKADVRLCVYVFEKCAADV